MFCYPCVMCTRETNSKDVMTIITWQRWQWLNQTFWMNMVYIENFQTKKKNPTKDDSD